MKKTFLKIIVAFLLIMTSIVNVYAESHFQKDIDAMVSDGNTVILCEYRDTSGNLKNGIYYRFHNTNLDTDNSRWFVTFHTGGRHATSDATEGTFTNVFRKGGAISYDNYKDVMPANMENNFTCPANSFMGNDWFSLKLCFGPNETCSSSIFDEGPYKLSKEANTIFSFIDKQVKSSFSKITLKEYLDHNKNVESIIIDKVRSQLVIEYKLGTSYEWPTFIENYIKNYNQNVKPEKEYNEFKERMKREATSAATTGDITEEQKHEVEEDADKKFSDVYSFSIGVKPVQPSEDSDCNGLLGGPITKIIQNIFKTIQYAGPALVAIFTIIDMIKAALSGEQDDIKKAKDKFIKRLIAAILLFFIPIICNMLLGIAGVTVPDTCIK